MTFPKKGCKHLTIRCLESQRVYKERWLSSALTSLASLLGFRTRWVCCLSNFVSFSGLLTFSQPSVTYSLYTFSTTGGFKILMLLSYKHVQGHHIILCPNHHIRHKTQSTQRALSTAYFSLSPLQPTQRVPPTHVLTLTFQCHCPMLVYTP